MGWVIFVLLVVIFIASLVSFKYGEIKELHKVRAEFEHFLDAHPTASDLVSDGIEVAEQIVDDLIEEELNF